MGQIVPSGPRLSFSLGGAIPALNDDLCLCKCSPPPKLVHSQTSFKEIIDDNKIVEYVEYVSKLKKQISTPIQNNFVPKGAYSASGLQEDLGCYCNKEISLDNLKKISVIPRKHLEQFVPLLNKVFRDYNINTCLRKSHFLAQIFLESGELALLEEQGISDEKEKSSYRGYKGRGLIQITFPEPYMEYGKYKGLDFTNENRKK